MKMTMTRTTNITIVELTSANINSTDTMLQLTKNNTSVININCDFSFVKDMELFKAEIALKWYCEIFSDNVKKLEKMKALDNADIAVMTSDEKRKHDEKLAKKWDLEDFQKEISETIPFLCEKLNINYVGTNNTDIVEKLKACNEFVQAYTAHPVIEILVGGAWDDKGTKMPLVFGSGKAVIAIKDFYLALHNTKASDSDVKKSYMSAKKELEELCQTISFSESESVKACKLHANQQLTRDITFSAIGKAYAQIALNKKSGKFEKKEQFHMVEREIILSCIYQKYLTK